MTENTHTLPAWGGVPLRWLVPGTRCVWGARAILTRGSIDLVPDRQEMVAEGEGEEPAKLRFALACWLNETALPAVRENVERWYAMGSIDGRTTKPYLIYHDDDGSVFGTPNASAGYLYLTAFLQAHLPEGHKTRGLEGYLDAHKAWESAGHA